MALQNVHVLSGWLFACSGKRCSFNAKLQFNTLFFNTTNTQTEELMFDAKVGKCDLIRLAYFVMAYVLVLSINEELA